MRTTAVSQKIRREIPDARLEPPVEALVRKWLVADDDFNLWFLETTKGKLDDTSLLALVEGYGNDQDSVELAWDDFRDHRIDAATLGVRLETSITTMLSLREK
ncbi:MAG TPA: hypothetical protein VIF62_32105 [Labilithrix sp.]